MSPIRAIYENGVLRPLTAVDLPEHCEVLLESMLVEGTLEAKADDEVLNRVLTTGYGTRMPDLA